jgi:hypothetical protein
MAKHRSHQIKKDFANLFAFDMARSPLMVKSIVRNSCAINNCDLDKFLFSETNKYLIYEPA